MASRRIKDVRVWTHSWYEVVPAAEVMMVRHLHHDHGFSIRKINRTLGMTDRMVKACLAEEDDSA